MKILVTGAEGQVGSDVVEFGRSSGFQIDAANRQVLDITNSDSVLQHFKESKPDLVINAAAYTAVDKAEEEKKVAFSINKDGVANLASACSRYNIPLLHLSTDYVFDGQKTGSYLETDQTNPKSVYGKSKLEGDKIVEKLDQYIILRVSWVFGAHGNNFVKTMIRLANERIELKIVDDQVGNPTWSGDIAKTLISISNKYKNKEVIPWGVYHYSGLPEVSWFQFANAIFSEATDLAIVNKLPCLLPIQTDEYPTAAKRPKNSVLNCSKIFQALDVPQPEWEAGLKQVLSNWNFK